MSVTQQFFAEGDIQEAQAWKNSPLLFEATTEPEAVKYTSFDRVPRRWKPIGAATVLLAVAAAGGAWAAGLWQPPPVAFQWAQRLDPRAFLFTPPAETTAETPPAVVTAPASVAAPLADRATIPSTPSPAAQVAIPATPDMPAGSAAGVPAAVAHAAVAAEAPAAAPIEPPAPVVSIPPRAPVAAVHSAPAAADGRPRGQATRRDRHVGSKALHGYVWSDQQSGLVPAGATPAALPASSSAGTSPDETLPLLSDIAGDSPARAAAVKATAAADSPGTAPSAPPEPPREHPPTSSASPSEPPPIPVPAIEPPKALPEPAEVAAPSAR